MPKAQSRRNAQGGFVELSDWLKNLKGRRAASKKRFDLNKNIKKSLINEK